MTSKVMEANAGIHTLGMAVAVSTFVASKRSLNSHPSL